MGQLAREGRFEFVQGGWVQNDEANTHYFAILNQMMDGHEWLKRNFPVAIPRAGWAIDPFGLSPFMAQVNKLFGLDSMHIQVFTVDTFSSLHIPSNLTLIINYSI